MIKFLRKHILKIKIALSLPAIIYLLIFIFNGHNLPINKKAVNKQWLDFIYNSGFDSFINLFTYSIGIKPFNIVEKILIFFILVAIILIAVLLYYKQYKITVAILFFISKYIYIAYVNFCQKLDIIIEISWMNLKFYREWSKEEIMTFIDKAIWWFNRPELESQVDKEDLLNFVLNGNFKTSAQIIEHLVTYIQEKYMPILIKSEGWENYFNTPVHNLCFWIMTTGLTIGSVLLIYSLVSEDLPIESIAVWGSWVWFSIVYLKRRVWLAHVEYRITEVKQYMKWRQQDPDYKEENDIDKEENGIDIDEI